MKKRIIGLLGCFVFLFLIAGCAANAAESEHEISTQQIGLEAAIINGEPILLQNIKAAYSQQSTDIQNPYAKIQDEKEILNHTIRELVVIQYGRSKGVSLSEEENYNFISELKDHMPDAYQRGVEAYGEQEYLNGLKMRQLFTLSKANIMDSLEQDIIIKMDEVNQYIAEHHVTGELTDDRLEVIKLQLKESKLKDKYTAFVEELMNQAEIEILIE